MGYVKAPVASVDGKRNDVQNRSSVHKHSLGSFLQFIVGSNFKN